MWIAGKVFRTHADGSPDSSPFFTDEPAMANVVLEVMA